MNGGISHLYKWHPLSRIQQAMDKRYQVFVSSTYADLQDERRKVIQALMEMDCIPAGMELFPAADDEQWEFIKRVIDDCDYYILIMGGRYGTLTSEGMSYTEREFDYALSKQLKVLAFVHGAPGDISVSKSDINPELRVKLAQFREKVCQDRLVKFWTTAAELPGMVALSLSKTIKIYPAIGWVRANGVASTEALTDINTLTKENAFLLERCQKLEAQLTPSLESIAGLDEQFEIDAKWKQKSQYGISSKFGTLKLSWADIFAAIAPSLEEHPSDHRTKTILTDYVLKRLNAGTRISSEIDSGQFETIRIQLSALGLISTQYTKTIQGGMGFFWSLTNVGRKTMVNLRTIKSAKQTTEED